MRYIRSGVALRYIVRYAHKYNTFTYLRTRTILYKFFVDESRGVLNVYSIYIVSLSSEGCNSEITRFTLKERDVYSIPVKNCFDPTNIRR